MVLNEYEHFIVGFIPRNLYDIWCVLTDNDKNKILLQSRFYNFDSEEQLYKFWTTRIIMKDVKYIRLVKLNRINKKINEKQ